ncbi:MAG: sulfatase-like hydrolase/transferase [Myxococcales bacterium]|nr:sulfatase-like hydrolase/transferase [Myxococcales bacterium]
MSKDPDGLDSNPSGVSALDALPPLPEIEQPPPLPDDPEPPPLPAEPEPEPAPEPELQPDDDLATPGDPPTFPGADVPPEEPVVARARRPRGKQRQPHIVVAWLAGLVLGAFAGLGLLLWEAALVQAAGLPFATGERLQWVAVGYVAAGAGIGLIASLAGAWGPRWATTAAATLLGWVAGAPVAAMLVQAGLPGVIGVVVCALMGITLGQLVGRVPAPGWMHLGLGAFVLCAVALLGPMHLHLMDGFGVPVAVITGLIGMLAVAMGLFTAAFTDTARLPWIPLATWVLLGAATMGASTLRPEVALSADSPVPGRPVVVITVAGLRADRVDPSTMPHLHRLAQGSLWFQDAHATSNWVVPSLGSVLTGRLPYGHGAGFNNGTGPTGQPLRPDVATLASVLRYSSWVTAGVSGDPRLRAYGLDAGFERWVDFSDDGMLPLLLAPLARAEIDPWSWPVTAPADWVTERALEIVETREGGGWMLLAHYADLQGAAAYDATVSSVDEAVGRLVASVPGNAWVVVVGTHGMESSGEPPVHAMAEDLLHVPLIMRVPGVAGARVPGVVSVADVAPTLLAGIGHRPLARAEGAPLERAFGAPQGARLAVAQSARTGREAQAVLMGDHKLVHGIDGSTLLFDLRLDPTERRAVAVEGAMVDLERDLLSALPAPEAARRSPPPLWMQLGQVGSRVMGRR